MFQHHVLRFNASKSIKKTMGNAKKQLTNFTLAMSMITKRYFLVQYLHQLTSDLTNLLTLLKQATSEIYIKTSHLWKVYLPPKHGTRQFFYKFIFTRLHINMTIDWALGLIELIYVSLRKTVVEEKHQINKYIRFIASNSSNDKLRAARMVYIKI